MTVFTLRATTALIPFVFLAAPAAGQNSQAPVVITPPVGDFSLPPSGQTPTPRPTAAPTPAPTSAPTSAPIVQPIPLPTPTPAAPPRATAPRPAQAPAVTAAPPSTAATPTPAPSLSPSPITPAPVQATPAPSATATPVSEPGLPGWFWPALGGAVLLVGGGLAGWWIGRRRRAREDAIEDEVTLAPPPPAAPPAPTPGPPPLAHKTPPAAAPAAPGSPARAPAPVAPVPPPDGPLVAEIRPLRAAIRDGQVTLDFELFVQNRGHEPADNIRAVLALLGANAEQDAQIARFHSAARLATGSEPFSVAPGAVHKLNAQVSLPGEQMQVVTVQGRAMFVPIVPLALKWYAGLSIRTLRDSFMIGTAPAPGNDKLGPLWVERAADGFGRLAAKRYVAKAVNA